MPVSDALCVSVRGRRADDDLAEEIEVITARWRRCGSSATGCRPRDGRRAPAGALMGNVTLAREDARAVWIAPWIDSAWQDVAYALRMFRRAPAFTGAMVLVMALGVRRDDWRVRRCSTAWSSKPAGAASRIGSCISAAPRSRIRSFRRCGRAAPASSRRSVAWSIERMHVRGPGARTDRGADGARRLLRDARHQRRHRAHLHRPTTTGSAAGRRRLVAVISDAAWQRRFGGDPAVIGQTRADRPASVHHHRRHSAPASLASRRASRRRSRFR